MPKLRARTSHAAGTPLNVVQQGKTGRGSADRGMPKPTTCVAPLCDASEALPDMPVTLCPKHLRETYEVAQRLVDDRWLPAVVALMDS